MAEIAVGLATKQAERLIGKLVDKLYATVSGELSLLLEVREEIRFVKDELKLMSAFAVEDCIDEFSLHLSCRSSNNNLAASLWRRSRSAGSLQARRHIAANIQSIKSRVKEVSERRLRYGIDEQAASTDMDVVAQYDPRSSALFVNESQLVGIDEPRKKLVEWLLDESKPRLSLIGVVGAGGLGKTTIVKRAYENPQVNGGHFQCCAWITVSQVYHIEGLLRSMIEQLFSSVPESLSQLPDWECLPENFLHLGCFHLEIIQKLHLFPPQPHQKALHVSFNLHESLYEPLKQSQFFLSHLLDLAFYLLYFSDYDLFAFLHRVLQSLHEGRLRSTGIVSCDKCTEVPPNALCRLL